MPLGSAPVNVAIGREHELSCVAASALASLVLPPASDPPPIPL
jgi:hypothetical protein